MQIYANIRCIVFKSYCVLGNSNFPQYIVHVYVYLLKILYLKIYIKHLFYANYYLFIIHSFGSSVIPSSTQARKLTVSK